MNKIPNGSAAKTNSHIAAGLKIHRWKEGHPFQFELDMNYRGITFYDSNDVKKPILEWLKCL